MRRTPAHVEKAIWDEYQGGARIRDLSRKYGVVDGTIDNIVKRYPRENKLIKEHNRKVKEEKIDNESEKESTNESQAFRQPVPARPVSLSPPLQIELPPLLPVEGMNPKTLLEEQINLLRQECARAQVTGDSVGYQRASRLLIGAINSYQKETKKDDDSEVIKVERKSIDDCAFKARTTIGELYARILAEKEEWPECPHCGQKMKPQ